MPMNDVVKVASIIQDAGGRVVGRTRLQKIAYLLIATGLEEGLDFEYKHYGPFSEALAVAARQGSLLGSIHEAENSTSWGGSYSIYTASADSPKRTNPVRIQLASLAASADAIDLELAATAVFLSKEGYPDPWDETARRKPEKVGHGHLDGAKRLLSSLMKIKTPVPLPLIA